MVEPYQSQSPAISIVDYRWTHPIYGDLGGSVGASLPYIARPALTVNNSAIGNIALRYVERFWDPSNNLRWTNTSVMTVSPGNTTIGIGPVQLDAYGVWNARAELCSDYTSAEDCINNTDVVGVAQLALHPPSNNSIIAAIMPMVMMMMMFGMMMPIMKGISEPTKSSSTRLPMTTNRVGTSNPNSEDPMYYLAPRGIVYGPILLELDTTKSRDGLDLRHHSIVQLRQLAIDGLIDASKGMSKVYITELGKGVAEVLRSYMAAKSKGENFLRKEKAGYEFKWCPTAEEITREAKTDIEKALRYAIDLYYLMPAPYRGYNRLLLDEAKWRRKWYEKFPR